VVLVSLSGTQLPHYVLYSTAPLFVLYARVLPSLTGRFWALPGLFVPSLIVALGVMHHMIPEPKHIRDQEQLILLLQLIANWWWPLVLATLSLVLLSLIASLRSWLAIKPAINRYGRCSTGLHCVDYPASII
jgi:hypothetical protein